MTIRNFLLLTENVVHIVVYLQQSLFQHRNNSHNNHRVS